MQVVQAYDDLKEHMIYRFLMKNYIEKDQVFSCMVHEQCFRFFLKFVLHE